MDEHFTYSENFLPRVICEGGKQHITNICAARLNFQRYFSECTNDLFKFTYNINLENEAVLWHKWHKTNESKYLLYLIFIYCILLLLLIFLQQPPKYFMVSWLNGGHRSRNQGQQRRFIYMN